MYCMPQEGTEAYLYFPEAEEESAYAVSEIHNSRCPVFADAQSRGLVTEHGKKMQLYADVLGVAGGKEETVQECRMGEDGIHFSAGKGKLQVTGSGQITFRAPEISLDAVQKIGQYKMESMAKEKAGMYGAEVMTLTVSGGLGLIPVGGTVVTLPQLAGAFLLVAGTVTSQNLLFQMREVLMFCISGKEMGAPTGNWLYDSARELTEMASMQFAVYGLMNPYTYQRPKITPLPNETGLTVPGGTGVAVVPNGTAPALKQPYLPGQYTEYPAAVQGLAQQALPGGGSGIKTSYGKSREIIQCNTKDAAADELAKRIGGQSRSAFADDPIQREFDVISDQYIAQAKPPLKCVNKTVRTQMKATFEAAKKYERKVYYQFEGIPSQEVLDKLYEHSERYGVEVIIDTEPLGILN